MKNFWLERKAKREGDDEFPFPALLPKSQQLVVPTPAQVAGILKMPHNMRKKLLGTIPPLKKKGGIILP